MHTHWASLNSFYVHYANLNKVIDQTFCPDLITLNSISKMSTLSQGQHSNYIWVGAKESFNKVGLYCNTSEIPPSPLPSYSIYYNIKQEIKAFTIVQFINKNSVTIHLDITRIITLNVSTILHEIVTIITDLSLKRQS